MKKTQVNSTIQTATKDFVKKRNRKRVSIVLSICLAVCAVVGVAYGVRHSGSAWNHITKEIVCEETVNLHQHTDDCYGFDEDGNEILICGYADYLVHTHNQYCFNDDNELICPLLEVEEHVHDDSCYVEEKVLICELEETEEEIIDDEIVEEEIIEDEIVEEEIIEDEVVEEEIIDEEILDDEIIEDEIINDDLEIIDDVETPLAGLTHQHDDSCYETRKVLICGELELHTHDDACYDEDGNLICGQLELKEHQHTEDCVIKRELTEEEIEALDKADPNAKTNLAEQIFTKTVETDEYIVTVTYNGLAEIPEEAELIVKEVELTQDQIDAVAEGTGAEIVNGDEAETVSETSETESSEEKPVAVVYKSLDICFMLDGAEIEPKAEVTVDVKFLDEEFAEDEMTITHIKDDGSTEVVGTQDIDEYSNINFTTDSFSIYTFTKASKGTSDLSDGTYAGYFEYKTNDTQNAFLTDEYARYRNDRGAMGTVASSFHIVAFDTARLNVHTNGNVLCKNLITNTNNWGTHSKDYAIPEVSYVQNSAHIGSLPEEGRGTGKDGQPAERVLAVGSSVYTESNNEKNYLKVSDNSLTVSQAAKYIVKDKDTESAPFIDLNQVYQEVKQISNNLSTQADINTVADFNDQNNREIRLTDPDSAGYYNMTANELNNISGTPIKFTGFETYDGSGEYSKEGNAKQGAIIVNVDCSGYEGWIKLPQETKVIFDGKKQVDRAEVVEFSGGKIIWNFYNITKDVTVDGSQVCGIILAPEANIRINNGNGNFIGKNVEINGESHRTDFTGTTVPFAASLTATKTVDGRTPLANEKFDFTLYEIVNGQVKEIQTVKNDGSNISFDKISYSKDSDLGEHWYFFKETSSGDSKYTYDPSAYIIKTTVTKSNNKYNATSEYFKTTAEEIERVKNITVQTSNPVNESQLVFNNLDSTSISVEKKWYAEDGTTELTADLPDSITVKLMQVLEGNSSQYGDDITLTKANRYAYTWDSLPRQDATGKAYSYYVEENPVEGFTQVLDGDPVKVNEGTITLKNVKNPKKTSVHIKKKFYLVEDENPKKDASLEVTDPTLFRPSKKYNESWEVTATLYVSADGGKTWEQCWPEVVLPNYENLPEDQKILYTNSQGTFAQQIHKASYDIRQADNWEITISNLPESGVYKGVPSKFTYKVLERMSCWSVFQYDYDNYTLDDAKKPLDNGGNVFNPDIQGGDTKYEPQIEGGITADGTYDYTLNNFGDGFIDVEILKNWYTVEGGIASIQNGANNDAFITLELTETVTGQKIGNYKLTKDTLVEVDDDGNAVNPQKYETEAKTNNNNLWSGKIKQLPKYVIKDGKLMFADYTVSEKVVSEEGENKFVYGSYVCTNVGIVKNSQNPREWTLTTVTLDNKNTESYELPRTGGHGTVVGLIKYWLHEIF